MIKLLAATLVAVAAAFAVPAQAETATVPTKTFDVYVDLPTGFTFVKMPTGWKFVGKVEAAELANLPTGVLTALLAPEEGDVRVAQRSQASVQ
jgi:hypothetical protein